jgi:hypothetical protein
LKPDFHTSGSRVETRRFQAMGQLHATCLYSPAARLMMVCGAPVA